MATTKKAAKQVQVIARYAHKTDGKLNGIVTYAVRSASGKSIYCTTLIEGKASGCSCPSRTGGCYHRTQLTVIEASRQVVEVAPVVVIEEIPAPVAIEAPKPTYRIISLGTKKERFDLLADIEARREHKSDMLGEINEIKARKRSEDRMMKAPLTQNRAFSILR